MTALDALQDCLSAEHACLYGYGVLGGVLAGLAAASDQARADQSYVVHRDRRDALTDLVASLDAEPVAAQPAYEIPFEITSHDACRRLARTLEHKTCEVYAFALSLTIDDSRAFAAAALTDSAVLEYSWGGRPQAFPGI